MVGVLGHLFFLKPFESYKILFAVVDMSAEFEAQDQVSKLQQQVFELHEKQTTSLIDIPLLQLQVCLLYTNWI